MTSYEGFVRAQMPRLLRYATMLTGDRELAADLVQDVLVKLFRQWSRVAETAEPHRYVMRMVTNQYVSWRRRWTTRAMRSVAEVPDLADGVDIGAEHAMRDLIWTSLARLPPRQRAVLVLSYYERLTNAEIAEMLGCTTTTVRGYAHRALVALRTDLSETSSLEEATSWTSKNC